MITNLSSNFSSENEEIKSEYAIIPILSNNIDFDIIFK